MAVNTTSPLNARLDPKSFIGLTAWFLLIMTAWAIAKWGFTFGANKVKQTTGAVSEQTGMSNPFFGGG